MDYEKLKQILADKNIMQKEMCNKIGIKETSLSGVRNGKKKPGLEMILKISKFLGIHPKVISPENADLFDFLNSSNTYDNKQDTKTKNLDIVISTNSKLVDSNYKLIDMNKETTNALVEMVKHITKSNNYQK